MTDSRIDKLVDAAITISGDLDLESMLRRIVDTAAQVIGAKYAALGVIGESGGLAHFVHTGFTPAEVETIGELPRGVGILGEVTRHPRPLRLEDLGSHEASVGFPPGHPPMRAFVGVPIRVRDDIFGNLYLCDRTDGRPFTEKDQSLVEAIAAIAGAAIANAQLADEVSRLRIVSDRERIGRDLHDTVIQRLFASGLGLQSLARRHRPQDPALADSLLEVVDGLDETIAEIRSVILSLQVDEGRPSLRARISRVVSEWTPTLGFQPTVRFVGPIDLSASERLVNQVLAVVREALSNVAQHAQAQEVSVTLTAAAGILEVVVVDDGVGIPLEVTEPNEQLPQGASGFGLRNLRLRAEDVGGTFEAEGTGAGTKLRWCAPI